MNDIDVKREVLSKLMSLLDDHDRKAMQSDMPETPSSVQMGEDHTAPIHEDARAKMLGSAHIDQTLPDAPTADEERTAAEEGNSSKLSAGEEDAEEGEGDYPHIDMIGMYAKRQAQLKKKSK